MRWWVSFVFLILAAGSLHAASGRTPGRQAENSSLASQENPQQHPEKIPDGEKAGTEARKTKKKPLKASQQYLVTVVEEKVVDVAGSVHVVTVEELRNRRVVRTLPEALREIPGVLVQKTGHGQGSPFIRGFTGFRTLLLIDGVRVNNSVFRDGPNPYWNTVDPLSVGQMEIIKGPSSVLFGSDAIGGTVNLVTRSHEEFGKGLSLGGGIYQRVATAENSYVGRVESSGNAGGRFSFLAGANVKNFGDLEGGQEVGLQPKTGYDEVDGDLKFEFFFKEGARLTFAHQRVDQNDAWRTHKTIFGVPWRGTSVGSEKQRRLDQRRHLTYLQYHQEDVHSAIKRLKFSLSYHRQEEQRFRIHQNERRDLQGFNVGTTGAMARVESPSRLGNWTYGIEFYRDEVSSFRRDFNPDGSLRQVRIQGPIADDANYQTLGIYAEDKISALEQLDIIVGARYSYSKVEAGRVLDPIEDSAFSIADDWSKVVASARALFHLDQQDRLNLFGGLSQGYRAPNLSDLTRFDTARSNEIETPVRGLDPESFLAYEVGLKADYPDWVAQVAYFYTDISRMIVRTPTGHVIEEAFEVTKTNSGDGFVHGVEIDTRF